MDMIKNYETYIQTLASILGDLEPHEACKLQFDDLCRLLWPGQVNTDCSEM